MPEPHPSLPYRFGVEEELQLVDPRSGGLRSEILSVLPRIDPGGRGTVAVELYQAQIEVSTPVCATLDEVRAALRHLRGVVGAAATDHQVVIAASGTHPFSDWREQRLTPKARYRNLAMDHRHPMAEVVVFGCHVHVSMPSREDAVQTMNRARVWMAPLLALTANSPFWTGLDTGYASFRTELLGRWPLSGTPQWFDSRDEYEKTLSALVAGGVMRDPTKVYWDMRPSERYPTLEFRVPDVQLTVDEAVMVAGLVRALARTCHQEALAGSGPPPRHELLQTAKWLAARDGLAGRLAVPPAMQALPAHLVVEQFLQYLRPALEAHGDWEEVSTLVERTLRRGNGAARQRAAFARAGRIQDVVDLLLAETTADR